MPAFHLPYVSVPESGTKAQRIVHAILERYLKKGRLILEDADGTQQMFGDPASDWSVRWIVHHERLYDRILRSPSLGIGEGFMDGDWDAGGGDVAGLIGLIFANNLGNALKDSWGMLLRILLHRFQASPASLLQSTKNVQHHYDLGNAFYAQMLDSTMLYSCGLQLHASDTLEALQRQKLELICRKLDLRGGETLIDVGCGWGGLLIHAAKEYGVHGTGITLSREQLAFAEQRVQEEGVADLVSFRLQDYRDAEGQFDKFVSVGMFEHVGKSQYSIFIRKMRSFLKPGGIGLLHTIGITDDPSVGSDPWTTKYMFPGGELPRLEQIIAPMRAEGLLVAQVENLKPHYAETLKRWHRNFQDHWSQIQTISPKFDERFRRMWTFYLQSSEASFRHSTLQLYQVLVTNDQEWNLPTVLGFHQSEKRV